MRFGIVIPEFHKRGGTERCVASLAEALARRGHSFTLFSNLRDASVLPQARWHRVPMLKRPHVLRFFSFFLLNPLVRVAARAKGEGVDVLFSTGPDTMRPTVAVFHCCARSVMDSLRAQPKGNKAASFSHLRLWSNLLTYRLVAVLEKNVVRSGAERLLAVSESLRSDLVKNYGVLPDRIDMVPDGVDTREFYPATQDERQRIREQLRIPGESLTVAFVGHAWERKGLGTLVAALELLQKAQPQCSTFLLVVGGAGYRAYEQTVTKRLDARCLFLGAPLDMRSMYAAADICVLPSELESFGLPILEAMACGVPGIVSRNAGVAEAITEGEDGLLLADPRDASELSSKIAQLVVDAELRARMGQRARQKAEQYSWDVIAQRFETICRQALGQPQV